MASGLFVLALATSCKDKPAPARTPATQGSAAGSAAGSTTAPTVAIDAAIPPPPVDAANLPAFAAAERALVTKWFARLNGTGKLEIKGVDVEPFRSRHVGQMVDAGTTIAWAMVPKDGKRTFVVVLRDARVYMTFDDKDALVGISY